MVEKSQRVSGLPIRKFQKVIVNQHERLNGFVVMVGG